MSKHTHSKILIKGLVMIPMMLLAAAFCQAAETESARHTGRTNPFEVVAPVKAAEETPVVEIIGPVKETGITQAQLQEAIQAALKAAPRFAPEPMVIETKPVEIIPEKYIKSVMLKFLRAENILPVVTNMLTKYGTASIDKNTNTLIICDSKESLVKILAEIAKVDRTPQQVLVEVVIVDVQLSNDKELGVNWDNLFQLNGGLGSVSYAQNLIAPASGGTLTLINGRIQNTIKALQKQRNTEILASPRILVLSGQEAYLQTVEEIPYTNFTQTGFGGGQDNAIASTSFKEAGITLTVKPTVTDEGRILIEVEPDQSINTGEPGLDETVPVVDRRKIKTTLLMEDGQIVVIGGLRSKDLRISEDKIPILGDIPYIGGLFSSSREVEENSELLIIISPHVYSAGENLRPHEKTLWNEAKELEPIRLSKKNTSIEQELASSLALLKKQRKK